MKNKNQDSGLNVKLSTKILFVIAVILITLLAGCTNTESTANTHKIGVPYSISESTGQADNTAYTIENGELLNKEETQKQMENSGVTAKNKKNPGIKNFENWSNTVNTETFSEEITERVSEKEVQKQVKFKILKPSYIPNKFKSLGITVSKDKKIVWLAWQHIDSEQNIDSEETISINEEIVTDNPIGLLWQGERTTINGNPAIIIIEDSSFEPGTKEINLYLYIKEKKLSIRISGGKTTLKKEIFIKIAKSLSEEGGVEIASPESMRELSSTAPEDIPEQEKLFSEEEAQEQLEFKILKPNYIPEGFEFNAKGITLENNNKKVNLSWQFPDEEETHYGKIIFIGEELLTSTPEWLNWRFGQSDEEITINENSAVIMPVPNPATKKDGYYIYIYFKEKNLSITVNCVTSGLEKETALKIAESISEAE